MAASSISVTEGSGKNIATHSISETTTKEIQRIELNTSAGVELATTSNPVVTQPQGRTASGVAVAANPLTVGGRAATTNPTAVADGQVVDAMLTKHGKVVVVNGGPRDLKIQQTTTITSSTSETTVLTAVASIFLDVYGIIVANKSATAATVTFKDATSGTTRFTLHVPAADTRGFMLGSSDAYSQAVVNNNWTATSSASVDSLYVTVFAVKNT